jgi:CBS domain-containing protein
VAAGIAGAPVLDDGGGVVGIVTEADLVAAPAFGTRHRALAVLADVLSVRPHHWATKATGRTVGDVMTKDVVSCDADDDVRVAARRMVERDVARLPVMDQGRLVGMVTRRDVLRALTRDDAAIAADVDEVLRTDPNRPDDHHVVATVAEGRVLLTGDVRYEWDAPLVVALVRSVEGVIGVDDQLHHREPSPRHLAPPWPWVTPVR